MKTPQLDRTASVTLKYLLHFLGLALFYGFMLYTTINFWLPFLVHRFSKVYYAPASSTIDKVFVIMLITYSLFCYFSNNFVLHLYQKGKTRQLIISIILDMLILPLSMAIVILYNNLAPKTSVPVIADIYNIYLITALLVLKVLILSKLFSTKTAVKASAR